jgi:hypothetical protein
MREVSRSITNAAAVRMGPTARRNSLFQCCRHRLLPLRRRTLEAEKRRDDAPVAAQCNRKSMPPLRLREDEASNLC